MIDYNDPDVERKEILSVRLIESYWRDAVMKAYRELAQTAYPHSAEHKAKFCDLALDTLRAAIQHAPASFLGLSSNETRSTNQDAARAAMPPGAIAGDAETPGGESGVPADLRKRPPWADAQTIKDRVYQLKQDNAADIIAAAFHDHYERLAPEYGYETRESSRTGWGEVPKQNRDLMRATVRSLLDAGLISTPVR